MWHVNFVYQLQCCRNIKKYLYIFLIIDNTQPSLIKFLIRLQFSHEWIEVCQFLVTNQTFNLVDSSWHIHKARFKASSEMGKGCLGGRLGKITCIFINFQQLNTLCMQDRGFVSVSWECPRAKVCYMYRVVPCIGSRAGAPFLNRPFC